MRTILGCLVLLTPMVFAVCGDTIGTLATTIDRWDFTTGNRGGGTVSYHWIGPENGEKQDVCLVAICHLTLDDLTEIRITPIAKEGFTFDHWEGDPANGSCEATAAQQDPAGILLFKVSRNGGCFAVFRTEGTPRTPPGIRR